MFKELSYRYAFTVQAPIPAYIHTTDIGRDDLRFEREGD